MKRIMEVVNEIIVVDKGSMAATQARLDNQTKPLGSLGRLEELAKKVVAITGQENPKLDHKVIFTLVGDHGVVEEGVSAYPQEVTPQMVYNFIRGGAGINVLARHVGARVKVIDMGVAVKIKDEESAPEADPSGVQKFKNFKDKKIGFGTKNMAKGPAMTREEAIRSIEAGIEVFEEELDEGIDILGIGDMGIGNTTPSSAIIACFAGEKVRKVTGRGTGIDDETFNRKVDAITRAIELNKPNPDDPIDVLTKVGGFEIGGLCGATLAAARHRRPVVVDGFIATAGALIAVELASCVKDYLIASHNSAEAGHRIMLDYMELRPLLDLDLRLGEGTGAALGIGIVEAGIKILTQMATFDSAGVSKAK